MHEERREHEAIEEEYSTISADTFKRLFLLNLVDGFRAGSYGLMRLHKIAYIAQRDPQGMKVFEFKRYLHGQYSETLDMIKDQLISMRYITALPLEKAKTIHLNLPDGKELALNVGGNLYTVTDRTIMNFYRDALRRISTDLDKAIYRAIREYGYLAEDELLRRCYEFPEFVETQFEHIIFESKLPDQIKVAGLSQDDCEELELSFNPKFISAMAKIAEGMDQSRLDLDKVERLPWVG